LFNYIIELEAAMHRAARNLDFEKAAELRDTIAKLRKKV
jgi:excinuclease UvrABC helicase subunit UvrB